MRHDVKKMPLPTADATGGAAVRIDHLREAAAQVHSNDAFDVTMKLQGKVSPPTGDSEAHDDWFDIAGGDITNAGKLIAIPNGVSHLRVFRTSVVTQGNLAVHVGGKNSRTDEGA